MSENEVLTFVVSELDRDQFKRLDQLICAKFSDLSRNTVKALFEKNLITSENKDLKIELKKVPAIGSSIRIEKPAPVVSKIKPQNLPLDILFEDEHLIIINKKAGMVVHPAPGHFEGTLVNAILYHCDDLTGVGDELRPGIVHRLDKGTSGVMVVAKNHKCHQGLIQLFSEHDIKREYECIVVTRKLAAGGTLDAPIGRHPQNRLKMAANVKSGKVAKTFYNVLDSFNHSFHVKCKLETGRTHQIRVHLSSLLRAPILNDYLYSRPSDHKNRLGDLVRDIIGEYSHPFLHARTLGFVHPITKEELLFEQEPPEIFIKVLEALKNSEV